MRYMIALALLVVLLLYGCIEEGDRSRENIENQQYYGDDNVKELPYENEYKEGEEYREYGEKEDSEYSGYEREGNEYERYEREEYEEPYEEYYGNYSPNISKNLTNITMQEVAKHNSKDDCWMVIEGKVYDVTSYVNNHPGGEAIIQGCGKDATELYNTRPMGSGTPHSSEATAILSNFYIGDLTG